ncbi:prostaglandin reductase 1-like [Diadema antillarum]|uniref:prostaglandin reductase 1-like n=1 Tax=Diadema antillarum TaxID=105358 RepID=UPI003A89E324
MAPASAKKFVLAKEFAGQVTESNFKLVTYNLPALQDGEVELQALYLTVDPYMRILPIKVGDLMIGEQVAKVVKSKDPKVPIGSIVQADAGWTSGSVVKGSDVTIVADYPDPKWPKSLALGTLGMPGKTAYLAFLGICKPKPGKGETVVVSGAAGAVGAVVGQIAKIMGCKVIGFAGSQEKLNYLKDLGYDITLNYKTIKDLDKAIKEAAPNGVDCYFDNVGGELSSVVMNNMNVKGRICVCGSISSYNLADQPKVPSFQLIAVLKQLTIQGFFIYDHKDEYQDALGALINWLNEGKIKYREHVTQGFENTPKAFMGLFKGSNLGKAIIKV